MNTGPRRRGDLHLVRPLAGPPVPDHPPWRARLADLMRRWIEECAHVDYFGLAVVARDGDVFPR